MVFLMDIVKVEKYGIWGIGYGVWDMGCEIWGVRYGI